MVDTPGAADSNPEDEYPNQTAIHTLLRHSKTIKVILALSFADIIDSRGANLLQMTTQLARFFKNDAILNDEDRRFIIPVCTNQGSCESEHQLRNSIEIVHKFIV